MIVDNGKYYVYRHIRVDKNEPFYIGVGSNKGKRGDFNRAYSIKGRNKIWQSIYNKTDISVEILIESDDIDFVMMKEKEFISLYGRICDGSGMLSNIDNGGYFMSKSKSPQCKSRTDHSISLCLKNAKNNIGKNHFNKNTKKIYAYHCISGGFMFGFYSATQAVSYLGDGIKLNHILRALDKNKVVNNYIFLSTLSNNIDTSKYKIDIKKTDYSQKAVLKIGLDGTEKIYKTIKEAALDNKMHKDSLSKSIKNGRKIRKGIFKFIDK